MRMIWLLVMLSGLMACTQLVFQPQKQHAFDIKKTDVVYENIALLAEDGTQLHGWWLPHTNSEFKAVIVFLHGNAGNVTYHLGNALWLTRHGFDVLLFDYRGFGFSQGQADLSGVMKDISAAIHYSFERNNKQKVIVAGQSLGASIGMYAVAQAANKDKVSAFLAISGFSDYQQIARDVLSNWWLTWLFQWPLSLTIESEYRPLDFVAGISPVPLLIMHSKHDEIIPYYHAKALYAAANKPKQFVELKGSHNNAFMIKENRLQLIEYLDKLTISE
ncbi:MAG: lysophospholipase [Gammaproteobacteria bacterium]|nr:lysophospholipase [Gammaproteobacteria bacterium]